MTGAASRLIEGPAGQGTSQLRVSVFARKRNMGNHSPLGEMVPSNGTRKEMVPSNGTRCIAGSYARIIVQLFGVRARVTHSDCGWGRRERR